MKPKRTANQHETPAPVRVSVFVGTSLDGFIARSNGSFDFLPDDPEPHGYEEFMASVDAMLIGRNTYETVLGLGGWAYGNKPVFVLSSRKLAPVPPKARVEHLSGKPDEVISQLASRDVRQVYIDGGYTIQQFLRAGFIDRLIITRVPVLIGSGISLFGSVPADIHLKHVATRSFASGLVQSEYHLLHRRGQSHAIKPLWKS